MDTNLTAFINEITKTETIYCLEDKNGIAFSESIQFKNDNNEPVPVICFWSNAALAKNCCVDGWESYQLNSMCLSTFIEDWLVQIYNDSLIVGVNFDANMNGIEVDPIDLILAITASLKAEKRDLEFEHFKSITDIEDQIKKLL